MSSSSAYKKKLIEVALPLDDINAASAREKSIRHGHPSTLHLWWARRPLATARAVIWASLVDDPSAHPEEFPTEEEQQAERERLFDILRELVIWENSNNPRVLDAAKAEIHRSMGDDVPALLDPFAGGGAIPLEAQRLGLKAYAQDLNPVAVTINKAMIEIPPKFAGNKPVNPRSQAERPLDTWEGNTGLAADVEYYGNWMREEAFRRIGHLYPKVGVPKEQGGGEATVIAWIWARTVKCPNPACGHETPLVRSFDLSKKKGKEWHVEPIVENGGVRFEVRPGKSDREGTVNRRGATCLHCGMPIGFDCIREAGKHAELGIRLMAVVGEGDRARLYLTPCEEQVQSAQVKKPSAFPSVKLFGKAQVNIGLYGLNETADLFTNRQLTALVALSDLVNEVREKAYIDAIKSGMEANDTGLDGGGTGASAYSEALSVYLQFALDKVIDRGSTLCCWDAGYQKIGNTFGRQALPMRWMFAESNPLADSTGGFAGSVRWVSEAVASLPTSEPILGSARQFDAQSDCGIRNIMVSTDPPYYDNIDYSDLSDYFYVWDRAGLQEVFPKQFGTMLTPKEEELVAAPYRFDGGKREAKRYFENGMRKVFSGLTRCVISDVPMTVYYGYKQSETAKQGAAETTSSSGWETILQAIIDSGFSVTGTWPMRTELVSALKSSMNALASSIVLVCRKRPDDAPICTRRELVTALRRELHPALDKLQAANIAPVDLAQSAIGPGIGVYSRYAHVLDADGSEMGVRAALQLINEELDAYFNDQSDGTDAMSRFCIELYTQAGFNDVKYGEAEVLANAKNVSIQAMEDAGLLNADKGIVHLLTRDQIEMKTSLIQPAWLLAQQLTVLLDKEGIEGCAKHVSQVSLADAERAKSLAYRLFTIADRRGWAGEAFAYNSLVTSWPDIAGRAHELLRFVPVQERLEF